MRVLVFGSTGQVARELALTAWADGTQLTFLDRKAADLSLPQRLGTIVYEHAPDAVIVAAAFTNVDAAESDEAMAHAVNCAGPAAIARATAARSIPVVYLSTDYVFDGAKDGFYDEGDRVNPLNAYGRSKVAGEAAVRAANPKHLILRTSWVYSAHGSGFLSAMLKPKAGLREVRVVADQEACPTAAADLADAIAKALPMAIAGNGPYGTFHVAGSAGTTRYGFAETIFKELGARGLPTPKAVPIATSDHPAPAKRPPNGKLSSARFVAAFGVRLRGYAEALPSIIDEALAESAASAVSEAS